MSLSFCLDDRIERILDFLSNVDYGLRSLIIRQYYHLLNIETIRRQSRLKYILNESIRASAQCHVFHRPVHFNQDSFEKIYDNFEDFVDVSRYTIKINADSNEIEEIRNLQCNETTLAQFLFFIKTLLKFLTENISILIHPLEMKQLFLQTPLRSFRVLFLLYEARDRFLRTESFDITAYKSYIIEYMRKNGHDIILQRLNDELHRFQEN